MRLNKFAVFICVLAIVLASVPALAAGAAETVQEVITANTLNIEWQNKERPSASIGTFRINGYNVAQLRALTAAVGGGVTALSDGSFQLCADPVGAAETTADDMTIDMRGVARVSIQYNVTRIRGVDGTILQPSQPGWVYLPDYQYNWGSIRDILSAFGYTIVAVKDDPRAARTDIVLSTQKAKLIVIDAGHQAHGDSAKEPIGPGASQTKPKVSSGTYGSTSGLYEYQLNLQVALKLQHELESRGYSTLMIRTTNDVNLSNSERAQMANEAGADAFIRIHANGSEDSSAHGALTICQTPHNPYNADIYPQCRRLSEDILAGLVQDTGCKKLYVEKTDTMSGINWSQVPVTIVEMGFMTNAQEDELMSTDSYQSQIAQGIADGIDQYFAK